MFRIEISGGPKENLPSPSSPSAPRLLKSLILRQPKQSRITPRLVSFPTSVPDDDDEDDNRTSPPHRSYLIYYRISGSGKTLEVRTLGCARRYLPLARTLTMISKLGTSNSQNKGHMVYTGSGHRCGVIPYSSVVWWIASWAEDE